MNAPLWTLPGPRRFLDELLEALRFGHSVWIALPHFGPSAEDLRRELRHLLRDQLDLHLRELALEHTSRSPRLELLERLNPPPGPDPFDRPLEEGGLLWLGEVPSGDAERWQTLLKEFAVAQARVNLLERSSCVLFSVGLKPPVSSVAEFVVLPWQGRLSLSDLRLLAAHALDHQISGLMLELACQSVAEVAQHDLSLHARLCGASIEEILAPEPLLENLRRERRWLTTDLPTWEAGSLDQVSGREVVHSALLSPVELRSRLWRAQLGPTMCALEEQRQHILEAHHAHLQLPTEVWFGKERFVLNDPQDFELPHLRYQLRDRMTYPERKALDALIDARNRLAHLKPLEAQAALELLGGALPIRGL